MCGTDWAGSAVTLILDTGKMNLIMAKYLIKCHLLYLEGGLRACRAVTGKDFGKRDVNGLLLLVVFAKT